MALRLVTKEDKEKYPYLDGRGISVNMYYEFPEEDEPLQSTSIQVPEGTVTTIHVPNNVHEHQYKVAPVNQSTTNQDAKKEAPTKKIIEKRTVKEAAKIFEKVVPVKKVKAAKEAPVKKAKVVPVKKQEAPKKVGKKGK